MNWRTLCWATTEHQVRLRRQLWFADDDAYRTFNFRKTRSRKTQQTLKRWSC